MTAPGLQTLRPRLRQARDCSGPWLSCQQGGNRAGLSVRPTGCSQLRSLTKWGVSPQLEPSVGCLLAFPRRACRPPPLSPRPRWSLKTKDIEVRRFSRLLSLIGTGLHQHIHPCFWQPFALRKIGGGLCVCAHACVPAVDLLGT